MLRNSVKLLISTIKHMRHINQLLLIPMTIWAGLELTFLFAQFTQVSARIFLTANDGLWGAADAVWQSQTSVLYGVLFTDNNEAAFSNYRLWGSAGFAFFYILLPRIRTRITLIILLVSLSVGISDYALVEYRWRTTEEKETNAKNNQVSPL
ncbi:unnamed protein product [Rotaria sp. Silwood1]|nr:unnamed protein product [Rotaria sp. Silwood1]